MPNRFSAAFRRKSATSPEEILQPQHLPSEPSSFRVLERNQAPGARGFDGGARMARASAHPGQPSHKPTNSEADEDNMFVGLSTYGYRGSGGSNITKATSTDTSSRHSNASTAPSSADMAQTHDDSRTPKRAPAQEPAKEPANRQPKGGSFLDRAGRTFSFGMQKKSNPSSPTKESIPDVPPLPTFQREDEYGRSRAMTASTTSTATPPRLEDAKGDGSSTLDLGGDFGSMFTSFDKRSSAATLRNDSPAGQRQPPPLALDTTTAIEPSPGSWNSQHSGDNLLSASALSPTFDRPPPVPRHEPRHQPSFEYRSGASPGGVEDADAKFLADSVAATRFLSDAPTRGPSSRFTRDQPPAPILRKNFTLEADDDDNIFAGTTTAFSRPIYRSTAPTPSTQKGSKVMTTAEFERYQKEKNRQHMEKTIYGGSAEDDDDDEDINYDDEEDEEEKLRAQAKFRRNKQAQMLAYRQQNMKTTGNLGSISPTPSSRPSIPSSLSAPHLPVIKTPSPEPQKFAPGADEDEDEEIPLAILQAHGFPGKNRAPSRLSPSGTSSMSNLRAVSQAQAGGPGSVMGEPVSSGNKRASALPVFARGLPQDLPPYVGANVSRPAVRESLPYGGGSMVPPQPQHPPIHPGGLVGVIASEERARAMRRGSPNTESQGIGYSASQNFDPMAGIPSHTMYDRGGPQGMPRMPQQPALTPTDQAQIQMTQQMSQFMQMQMQFMQMMAGNQGQNGQQYPMGFQSPQQMQQGMMPQQPYGMVGPSQSHADLSSAQSISGQPRRLDPNMRTMSMIQPSTSSIYLQGGYGSPAQGPGVGYTPSIAPSERSNIGLPGRYRPVSQVGSASGSPMHQRSQSFSAAMSLSGFDDAKSRSTIKAVSKPRFEVEDDDEEGWEAMKAKRDQKKSRWRRRKDDD